jgi:hypothetical protein
LICNAIVLKNWFPKKNKVTILHEHFGKINFFVNELQDASKLCNGSLIFCDIKKKESSYQCDFIDIYFVPLDPHRYDLYFIHDILKICLNFAPWHIMMSDVVSLIVEIYKNLDSVSEQQKKIYLLKLFLYLGIFPEDIVLYQVVVQGYRSQVQDIDQLLHKGLDHCWMSDQI